MDYDSGLNAKYFIFISISILKKIIVRLEDGSLHENQQTTRKLETL